MSQITREQLAFMNAIKERYAVKSFDPSQKIDQEILTRILEAGQFSPTSFGLEFTRFMVIRDQAIKEALKPLCANQAQIDSCSDLIVFISRNDMQPDSDYVQDQFKRWGLPPQNFAGLMAFYTDYVSQFNDDTFPYWAGKQAYIAFGNMMTAAQLFGIGSCPIEGFDKPGVMQQLNIDPERYSLHALLALGTPNDAKRPKYRLPLEELVSYH